MRQDGKHYLEPPGVDLGAVKAVYGWSFRVRAPVGSELAVGAGT